MYRLKSVYARSLVVLVVLVLAALACNLPFDQAASTPIPPTSSPPTEQLYTEPPELFPTATDPIPQVPTLAAATEIPPTADRINFNGVSFNTQQDVFSSAVPQIDPAVQGEAGTPGWPGSVPEYYRFDLQGYPLAQPWIQPQVLVYPIHSYAAVNPPAGMIAGKLDSQLRVVEMAVDSEPFLPMWNAAQVFFARPEIKTFENGKGIRYLSCYAQAFMRIDEHCLFYTYQGLSADGNYYISAIFPVDLPALHTQEADNQWSAVQTDATRYQQYVNETRQILGSAQAE